MKATERPLTGAFLREYEELMVLVSNTVLNPGRSNHMERHCSRAASAYEESRTIKEVPSRRSSFRWKHGDIGEWLKPRRF